MHAGIHPVEADCPRNRPPLGAAPLGADTTQEQTPPGSRHHQGADTPPGSKHPLVADTPQEHTPPWEQTPPLEADTPLEQTPLWEQTPPPREQTPPPPPREADCSIRSTSGRYTSYWNAFFFIFLSPFVHNNYFIQTINVSNFYHIIFCW